MTFRLDLSSATTGSYDLRVESGSVGMPEAIAGMRVVLVPTLISRAQAYYWSQRWQRDEAESLAELEAGDSVTFASGDDAVRWLLSADDGD